MPSRAAALVKVVVGGSKSSDGFGRRNRARRKCLAFGRDQVGIEADGHLEGIADTGLQILLEQAPRPETRLTSLLHLRQHAASGWR
jgi:hypothetical protein